MDKYLQQILNEVNTIIIPGLGALTLTNKSTGDIMFMSFLKHDDGNLSKYIAEKENMADNDAKNLIAKYVREIQAKLDSGDSYDMYQFGRFIKKNGDTEFENWNSYQHDTANPAPTEIASEEEKPLELTEEPRIEIVEEATPAEPVDKKEVAPIIEEVPATPVVEKVPEPKAEPTPEPKAEEVKPIVVPEEPKIDVSKIKPDENVYIPEAELKDLEKQQAAEPVKKATAPAPGKEPAKPTTKTAATKPVKEAKPPKEKKKRSPIFWALIIVGIIVVLGGGATAVFFKDVRAMLTGKTENTETMLQEKEDAKAAEEAAKQQEAMEEQVQLETEPVTEEEMPPVEEPASEIKEEPKAEPAPAPSNSSGGSFHIIAGGFANEANATRFAQKLQGEGKASSVLGKFDDLYLVSYESFNSREEATSALKNASVKGWVFKYPK